MDCAAPRRALFLAVVALAAAIPGCGLLSGGRSDLVLDARTSNAEMRPNYTSAFYRTIDENTVDVVMTDLPVGMLLDAAEGRLSEPLPAGNITRVHVFLNPRAGYTPIDYTASNASFTHVVVSGEVYGVYTGAGFVLPSTSPGDSSFSGQTNGANLRLAASTPGFEDQLGPTEVTGRVAAPRDDAKAEKIAALVSAMARYAGAARVETGTSK